MYIGIDICIYIYMYTYVHICIYTHLSTEIMSNNMCDYLLKNMGFKLGHFPAAIGIILFTPLILHLYLFASLDFTCRGSRFQI